MLSCNPDNSELDLDLLNLIKAHFVIAPVIETCRSRRLVAGELLRELERSIIHQIVRDARRPKCVTANQVRYPRILSATLHHPDRIVPIHCMIRQLARSSLRRTEEGTFLVLTNARRLNILMQVIDQVVVRENLMVLSALFVETHFPLHSGLVKVLDLHVDDRAHPCKRVDHHADQCPISQSDKMARIHRLEKLLRFVRCQHRRLAFLRAVLRATNAGRRIIGNDLPDNQAVEKHSECCEMLLDRLRVSGLFHLLRVSRDDERLKLFQPEAFPFAPGIEMLDVAEIKDDFFIRLEHFDARDRESRTAERSLGEGSFRRGG